MKTLQNNFTTPEQSKRLLELGVPANSADCIYPCYKREGEGDKLFMYGHINIKHPAGSCPKYFIPCWSVGRLIEIFEKCTGERFSREIDASTLQLKPLIEGVIEQIEKHLKMIYRRLDLSKLEK